MGRRKTMMIVPLEARTKGVAEATSPNWIWNFLVVMITPNTEPRS
jgi:hypothetical protein